MTRNLQQQTAHITLTLYYKGEVKAMLQLQKLLNRYYFTIKYKICIQRFNEQKRKDNQ